MKKKENRERDMAMAKEGLTLTFITYYVINLSMNYFFLYLFLTINKVISVPCIKIMYQIRPLLVAPLLLFW